MNPPASSSASENQGAPGWGCDQSWADRHHPHYHHHHHHHHHSVAMSVGLESSSSRQFQGGRMLEYEWGNPMLFPGGGGGGGGGQMDEEDERKPHIISGSLTPNMGVQYNGNVNVTMNGNGMLNSSGFSHNFSQNPNPLGNLLSSSGNRSFGGVADGIRSASSSLLYLGGGGNGLSGYCDSRAAFELQRHHLLGMMGIEPKSLLHDCIVKREELCPGDFQARIGLNLGGRTYFSAEDNIVNRLYKRPRAISPGSQVARCQAEGCKADLSNAKHYHRRHKVCELHSKASTVVTGGLTQRFCQQCSRFHILSEFDEGKRSCRKRLADHNRRRRKPQPNAAAVTPLTIETTTALKAVEDEENGESNHTTASLHRPEPICRTEAQALLTAISLSPSVPLVLQNGKGQQHYLQQTGPNLSLGGGGGGGGGAGEMALDYARQPGGQNYNGLEIAIPWLRPAGSNSEFTGSEKNSSNVESGGSSSNVQVFSSIQNLLPLQSSTDQLGSPADWMVNTSTNPRNQHYGSSELNLQTSLESQQMFSLLEKEVTTNDRAGQQQSQNEVEYLSVQHQQQGGLNSKHSVDGHSEPGNQLNTSFSGIQSLRSLGQSVYRNIL